MHLIPLPVMSSVFSNRSALKSHKTYQSGRNQSTHARLTMPSHLMSQMSSPRFSKANRRDMGDVGLSYKNGTAANFFEVI